MQRSTHAFRTKRAASSIVSTITEGRFVSVFLAITLPLTGSHVLVSSVLIPNYVLQLFLFALKFVLLRAFRRLVLENGSVPQ